MGWRIANLDPYLIYFIQEVTRWVGDNAVTILALTAILQKLKSVALKSKNIIDDKVISLLIYIFSLKWMKKSDG